MKFLSLEAKNINLFAAVGLAFSLRSLLAAISVLTEVKRFFLFYEFLERALF